MEEWKGKVAVVTGASVGIGEAIVKELARNGINVVGLARRSEKIEEYANKFEESKGKIYAYKCDVSDLESVKSAFKWIEEKFGVIHILVNNAAVLYGGGILDDNNEQNNVELININVTGAVYCAREGIKLIKKSNDQGVVVNVSSLAGHKVYPELSMSLYPSSKFAMTALSETLRLELNNSGFKKIRVTNLSPGAVQTDMIMKLMSTLDQDLLMKAMADPCMLTTEDIALSVKCILELPYNVNVTEMTIHPAGDKM
jgi:NADP+-dependent farnesol dehydrogenase